MTKQLGDTPFPNRLSRAMPDDPLLYSRRFALKTVTFAAHIDLGTTTHDYLLLVDSRA